MNQINLKHSVNIVANKLNPHPDKFQSFYKISISSKFSSDSKLGPSIKVTRNVLKRTNWSRRSWSQISNSNNSFFFYLGFVDKYQ